MADFNETHPYALRHGNFLQDVQMVTCVWVQSLEPKERCAYAVATPQCSEDVFIFNYNELFYCSLDTSNLLFVILGTLGLIACCGLLFITLGVSADGFFWPSLKVLSAMMGLNENVAGVTLLAFGNCAPDMITNITGLSGESRHLYSDTLASPLFVVFCVAGSIVALVPFTTEPTTFLRDSLFLLLSVLYIDYSMHTDKTVSIYEGAAILGIYFMYILVVCLDQFLVVRHNRGTQGAGNLSSFPSEESTRISAEANIETPLGSISHISDVPYNPSNGPLYNLFAQFLDSINPIDRREFVADFELNDHRWSKLLICTQFITLPLFVWAINMEQDDDTHFPLELFTLIVTVPLALLMFIFSRTDTTPSYYKYFSILTAVGSVYIIFACAPETISILGVLGLATQRSNSFLGCTLLAWSNSIGDLVANVALAR